MIFLKSAMEAFGLRVCCVFDDSEYPKHEITTFEIEQRVISTLAYTVNTLELASRKLPPLVNQPQSQSQFQSQTKSKYMFSDLQNVMKEREKRQLRTLAELAMAFSLSMYNVNDYTTKLAALHLELSDPVSNIETQIQN
jgi:hypothetical protein